MCIYGFFSDFGCQAGFSLEFWGDRVFSDQNFSAVACREHTF
jgi:hypothetical protein